MRKQGAAGVAVAVLAFAIAGCGGAQVEGAPEKSPSGASATEVAAETVDRVVVPDVVGKTAEAAAAAIDSAGLSPSAIGEGSQVASQTPSAGISVEEGSEVLLNLADPEPDGSRALPYDAGATVTATLAGGAQVSLAIGAATWNADAAIMAENQFNDPAPEGSSYVLVPITVTNVSSADAIVPWLAWDIAYVTPDGRSFDEASAVIPGDISDVGDLYEGGVGTGNIVFVLPLDAQGGLWAASYGWSDPVFITAS